MGFADDWAKICKRAGDKAETVTRKAMITLADSMIEKSPVGNPDLWEANKKRANIRENYNAWAAEYNDALGKASGKIRRKSSRSLRMQYGNIAGKDYVGGRFRGNWVAGIGAIDKTTDHPPSKTGAGAKSRISAKVDSWKPGQTIFITNSLPYALRLENGWSKQAPSGMVDLSVQQFKDAVAKAAREVKNS